MKGTATSSFARSAVTSKRMTKLCGPGVTSSFQWTFTNSLSAPQEGGSSREREKPQWVWESSWKKSKWKLKSQEQRSILLPLRYFQKYSQFKTQKQTKEQAPTCIRTSENPEVGKIMSLGKRSRIGRQVSKAASSGVAGEQGESMFSIEHIRLYS